MVSEEFPRGFPMLAPVAMQQGKALGDNLKRMLKKKDMKPFKYFDKGSMATVGRNRAVVDLPNKMSFQGFFAWFVWLFVHLMFIIGFKNRLVILTSWIWNYFTYDRSNRLIIPNDIKTKKATLYKLSKNVTASDIYVHIIYFCCCIVNTYLCLVKLCMTL